MSDTVLMVWQVWAVATWADGHTTEGPVKNVLFYERHAVSFVKGMNSVNRVAGPGSYPIVALRYYAVERPAYPDEVRALLACMGVLHA